MINEFAKNVRRYPTLDLPLQLISPSQVLMLPPSTINIVHTIEHNYDDQNDCGGLNEKTRISSPIINTDNSYRSESYYNNLFGGHKEKNDSGFTWIIPGVIAGGRHPFHHSLSQENDLEYLREEGFGAIVSAVERPINKDYLNGFEYLFVYTPDGYSNNLLEICKFIKTMEDKDIPVFIHCLEGYGRTGTIIAAYLIYSNMLTVDEAIEYVRTSYHSAAIETSIQEAELHRLTIYL